MEIKPISVPELILELAKGLNAREQRRRSIHRLISQDKFDNLRKTHTTFLTLIRMLSELVDFVLASARFRENDIDAIIDKAQESLVEIHKLRDEGRAARRECWESARALSAGNMEFLSVLKPLSEAERGLLKRFLTECTRYAQFGSEYNHRIGMIISEINVTLSTFKFRNLVDDVWLRSMSAKASEIDRILSEDWGRCASTYALLDARIAHRYGEQ